MSKKNAAFYMLKCEPELKDSQVVPFLTTIDGDPVNPNTLLPDKIIEVDVDSFQEPVEKYWELKFDHKGDDAPPPPKNYFLTILITDADQNGRSSTPRQLRPLEVKVKGPDKVKAKFPFISLPDEQGININIIAWISDELPVSDKLGDLHARIIARL